MANAPMLEDNRISSSSRSLQSQEVLGSTFWMEGADIKKKLVKFQLQAPSGKNDAINLRDGFTEHYCVNYIVKFTLAKEI